MMRPLWTAVALTLLAGAAHATTLAEQCESGKNKAAGKYAFCRQKTEAKFAVTGDAAARTAALQRCLTKYDAKWTGLEAKAVAAGAACPSTGDQTVIQQYLDTATADVATALAGGALPECPGDLVQCQGDLGACTTDLATCQAAPQGQPLRTGQTQCWDTAGTLIPCAGTGHDGELQKGLARAYVDNGDGTITDTKTGLMWEKLSDDASIHDKDTTYTWADAFAVKVVALNGGGGFAGYTDWRVPNRFELYSLVNLGAVYPAVFPAFNTGCAPACTVLTCSCTQ